MASTEKECKYIKCKKMFFGGKRAMYCCPKHGTYQRRLNEKDKTNDKAKQES